MPAHNVKHSYEEKHEDAYRTISEVADELGLPQHVLRFWETRFSQIRPMKRGGGRRFYRKEDVDLIKAIKLFLYGEGLTIRGLQKVIKEQGMAHILSVGRGEITLSSGATLPKQASQTARILQESLVKHIESQQSQEEDDVLSQPLQILEETPQMSDYKPLEANAPTMKFRPLDDEPEILPAFMRSVSATKIEPVPVVNRFQARLNQHSGDEVLTAPNVSMPRLEPVISAPKFAPLPVEKSSRLQAAYYELSECKRLLEGVLR